VVLLWKLVPSPQQATPSPRYYRKFYLQNRGITAVPITVQGFTLNPFLFWVAAEQKGGQG